jgi:hypothetical protein
MSHLTDDQLIDCLYGTNRMGEAHLLECAECGERYGILQERRREAAGTIEVDVVDWASQRRQVLKRVSHSPRPMLRWAPVLATALLLAAGAWFYRPASEPVPAPQIALDVESDDEAIQSSWFEDTYSAAQVDEPRAANPIRVLFEAPAQEEKVTE